MSETNERRTFKGTVEVRAEGEQSVAVGYAARFDALSQNLGGFVERIDPKAFNQTVTQADVRALFNHDANYVLGRSSSGTLRMDVDDEGLRYEIDLPPTATGRDLAVLLKRGDISGSSFGFRVLDDEWGETEDGYPLRTLKAVALRDVGPVTFPAYTAAESALRSLAEARNLDLDELVSAAKRNELGQVIAPQSEDESSQATPTAIVIPRSRGVR
tara:strand:+ start:291 stop:935 length:645 start_codon:yes stop_codon:yes gene_type:complete